MLENIKYESITFALPIADKILKKYKKNIYIYFIWCYNKTNVLKGGKIWTKVIKI